MFDAFIIKGNDFTNGDIVMNKEFYELVDAVRGLGVERTGNPAPRCVKITGDPRDFSERLERLQLSLEAFDAAGSSKSDGISDPAALRKAIDGLLKLIQVKGVSMTEADMIVRNALSLDGEEKKKAKGSIPAFKPPKLKKKRGYYSLRLKVLPDRPGSAKIEDLIKIVHELDATASVLGATVPKEKISSSLKGESPRPPSMGIGKR